jgi:hypothetical protein
MAPEMTTANGTSSHSAAASTMPYWPCASERAASVRCMMNWLSPQ